MSVNFSHESLYDAPPAFSQSHYTGFVALLLGLAWVVWTQCKITQKLVPDVHVVGGTDKHDIRRNRAKYKYQSKEVLVDGYQKSGGEDFYYVPSAVGERLIIPTRFMEELKSAPMDKVDFIGVVRELMEGRYTGVGNRSRLHPNTLKSHVTPRLASIMPGVQEEVHRAIADALPPCEDWTEVAIVPAMTHIVARASSRMMGGSQLSGNEEWIRAAIQFSQHAFYGAQKIKALPWAVRPLVAPFIREIRKDIPRCFEVARRVAVPILEQRDAPGGHAENDFLSYMKDAAKDEQKENNFIAMSALLTAFASVHTSTGAVCQLIYDLCAHPVYMDMLRREYSDIVGEDSFVPLGGFNSMTKMDSCMKESQRFWPSTLLTFERILNEDRTLSNGMTVPGGTHIGVCNYAIGMDPKLYPNPETFDGLRFERMRQEDQKLQGRAQYVSCNPSSLTFGYGRHACPGRHFLADEFKTIMGHLLENYDIKFKEGQLRPEPAAFESQYITDPSTIILMKRRRTSTVV